MVLFFGFGEIGTDSQPADQRRRSQAGQQHHQDNDEGGEDQQFAHWKLKGQPCSPYSTSVSSVRGFRLFLIANIR